MLYLTRLFFRILFLPWVRWIYRVRRIGAHNVPDYGGVLLLPNHVSYIDSFVLYLASPRPLRFITVDKYLANPAFGWFLKLFDAIPIDRSKPRDAIEKTVIALKKGDMVCIFPEGGLTRSGVPNNLKRGCELIARKSGAAVVPCYVDGLWESIFSYEREQYIKKWPKRIPCPLQVAFAPPLEAEEARIDRIFEGMLEASVDAFGARRSFETNLETAVINALKTGRKKNFSYEYAKEPRRWTRAQFLSIAMSIARRWINSPPDERQRIGILLPPGPTPSVINLGLFLAGKTPVNLPFNLRADQVEKLAKKMEELGIRTVITSKAFMPHLIDFWRGEEGRFIDIQSEMTSPGALVLSQEKLFGTMEPAWLTRWRLEVGQRDPNRETIGLIEKPEEEAIFLSSDELHRSITRVMAADYIREKDTILSEFPMNSIVGQLMQLWVPILNHGRTICRGYSVRDDNDLLRALADGQKADLMVGDFRFYRDIDRPVDLPRIRYGMVFDDHADTDSMEMVEREIKLPLARAWSYAGRILAMSLPPEKNQPPKTIDLMSRKPGSVGRFLPGVAGRVRDGAFSVRFRSAVVSRSRASRNAPEPPPEEDWIEVKGGGRIDSEGFIFLGDE